MQDSQSSSDEEEPTDPNDVGLQTGLRPTKPLRAAPIASDLVETFLKRVEDETINMAFKYKQTTQEHQKSSDIRSLVSQLKTSIYTVVVPTDKTNSFRTMDVHAYEKQMLQHLQANGREIDRDYVRTVFDAANDMYRDKKHLLSKHERAALEQCIQSKAIPTPKLLIKDHKPIGPDGNFPTRLVIPAQNFTSAFPRLGYLGIKAIFDKHEVQYMKKTIVQASDVKRDLETMNINCSNTTIVSLDAVDFYPSVRFKLVKKAIRHYS